MTPVLRRGSAGALVLAAQQALIALGLLSRTAAPGTFGPMMETAVRAFQRARGLAPSGVIDAQTWAALVGVGRAAGRAVGRFAGFGAATSPNVSLPTLRLGSTGPAVNELQRLLVKLELFGADLWGKIDPNVVGPFTAQAVKAFQAAVGMPQTGVVDATTWTQLYVKTGEAKFVSETPAPTPTKTAMPGVGVGVQTQTISGGPPVPARRSGAGPLLFKLGIAGAVGVGAYFLYKKAAKQRSVGLLVEGYDDAGPTLPMRAKRAKAKRAKRLGSKEGRGVEPGEGAPDPSERSNPRARRLLRRQREMYPKLTPDPVLYEMEQELERPQLSREEYESLSASEKVRLRERDAATRAKWLRAGKKRGPVGPRKGTIESDPAEGTKTHGRTAVRTRREVLIDEEGEPFVEEILISPGRAPATIRLEADPSLWKQPGYKKDMKIRAQDRADANDRVVEIVARGTSRVLYTQKPRRRAGN